MSSDVAAPSVNRSGLRGWFVFLAVYSFILAVITAIPQFYIYTVCFAYRRHRAEHESAGRGVLLVYFERRQQLPAC
jgi:hypothetical protein